MIPKTFLEEETRKISVFTLSYRETYALSSQKGSSREEALLMWFKDFSTVKLAERLFNFLDC